MDLVTAKDQFLAFTRSFANEADRRAFFDWLGKEVIVPHLESQPPPCNLSSIPEDQQTAHINGNGLSYSRAEASQMLEKIAGSLRNVLPLEAVLPSESIVYPSSGEDAGLSPQNCVHVDSFLYDEAGEEVLVEEGKLARSFCQDCGSRNVEELTYITHSCSKERLQLIFSDLLPPLAGKTVVDVGSRLGAVLYGAYYLSQASKIIGLEINADFCRLQEQMVQHYSLGDRVSIHEGDMMMLTPLLASSDVTILNNVFSFFMPDELQVKMWQCLYSSLSPGSLLVTIPSLETSLQSLPTGINISSWVRPMSGYTPIADDDPQVELSEIKLYQVLARS